MQAVYTDVWASMGEEHLLGERLEAFRPFALDADVLAEAIAEECGPYETDLWYDTSKELA